MSLTDHITDEVPLETRSARSKLSRYGEICVRVCAIQRKWNDYVGWDANRSDRIRDMKLEEIVTQIIDSGVKV